MGATTALFIVNVAKACPVSHSLNHQKERVTHDSLFLPFTLLWRTLYIRHQSKGKIKIIGQKSLLIGILTPFIAK